VQTVISSITNCDFHNSDKNTIKEKANYDIFHSRPCVAMNTWFTDRPSILLTHPCETRSCLEMSHGRTPWCAISTILWRTMSGSGRPLTKTPPSWFTPPWPADIFYLISQSYTKYKIDRDRNIAHIQIKTEGKNRKTRHMYHTVHETHMLKIMPFISSRVSHTGSVKNYLWPS